MNSRRYMLSWLGIGLLSILGCYPSVTRLHEISVGMSKQQVVDTLDGIPPVIKATLRTENGATVDVWKYRLRVRTNEKYWFFFVDGTLARMVEIDDDHDDENWMREYERLFP